MRPSKLFDVHHLQHALDHDRWALLGIKLWYSCTKVGMCPLEGGSVCRKVETVV